MRKIPVFSTDDQLNEMIMNICRKFKNYFKPVFFDNKEKGLEFLKYELPEINIINLSDRTLSAVAILDSIKDDPWLHYGGIIGVYSFRDDSKFEQLVSSLNLIGMIRVDAKIT